MKYRALGNSDIQVSEIGFGCMSLTLDHPSDDIKLIRTAIDKGITYFDTADLYNAGENEQRVGEALRDIRQQVVIGTKVGNQLRADGSGWDWNPAPDYILSQVEVSLRRLQTDYIDLYMLHGGTLDDPIDDTIAAFEKLKDDGKIRHYGISSIRPNVIREWVKRSGITAVMMQYSLLDRRPEEECLDLLATHNIGVLARGVLAKGMLVDKPAREYLGYPEEAITGLKRKMKEKDMKALYQAIGYVLKCKTVSSAVIGMRTSRQLEDVSGFSGEITDSIYHGLQSRLEPNVYENHR